MKATTTIMVVLVLLAGCKQHGDNAQRKTRFPGMVTADGRTSGQVMAAHGGPKTNAGYAGGTPGIAGGSGGNTGGAATGGAVRETGQGPSQGVTPPSGAGTQGTTQTQPGDHGKPAAPTPAETGPQPGAVNRDPSHSAAPGR
ncbi:MAG: hypothetical protein ACJ8HJ_20970 [Massilia sp.]|jgi:hypothetical protein